MSEDWDYGNGDNSNFWAVIHQDNEVKTEQRMFYNIETGEIGDVILTNTDHVDTDPYIVVTEEQKGNHNKIRQRIKDKKIVDIDTSTHVYWKKTPYNPLTTNPYYNIGKDND